MSDNIPVTWDDLTEDKRLILLKIARSNDVYVMQDNPVEMKNIGKLEDLRLIGSHDSWFIHLTWKGFRIIPLEKYTEIDASLNTSA